MSWRRDTAVRVAEVYMFDTCTHRCGYCWLAESGQVLDADQLKPFRDPAFIDRVARFFNSRTEAGSRWQLVLTGGEPLIAPNLDRLCTTLFDAGNRVSFNTALLVPEGHAGFRFLLSEAATGVEYVMASFHPEAELDAGQYFRKVELLKKRGHSVIVRYVGHPARLGRLDEFAQRCRDLDVSFYPTTLFSNVYPRGYTSEQRELLEKHFSSVSQHVQLAGGLRTEALSCYAGDRLIAVNLQTGNITPCVTVEGPSLGNVFTDTLRSTSAPRPCPAPGIACVCDVHFQQDIVGGVEDSEAFSRHKRGFVVPAAFHRPASVAQLPFYVGTRMGVGEVADDTRLFFTKDEVKARWGERRAQLGRRADALGQCQIVVDPSNAAAVGGVGVVRVSLDRTAAPLRSIELFVNVAPDASTNGEWRLIGSRHLSGQSARVETALDATTLEDGIHRIALNVHFADDTICYWYAQPPVQFEVRRANQRPRAYVEVTCSD